MSQVISEYMNDDRTAVIRKESEGYEVDLYKNKILIETRKVHNHSNAYAEDVADNYVLGVFDAVEKDGSFYGYNQKNDNFYPGLDD
jgi:hypothetical protein